MAGLLGETVNVRVYFTGTTRIVNAMGSGTTDTEVYNGSVVVGNGVEVPSTFFTYTPQSDGGGNITASGNVTVDLTDTGYTISFAGTAQPYGLTFVFSSLAGESIGTVTAAAQTAANPTQGVNGTKDPTVDAQSIVTSGFNLFGYQPDTNISQTVRLTFTDRTQPANAAPVAVNDAYSASEDVLLSVPSRGVLSNDTDAENASLSAVLVAGPQHGTLSLASNGSFTYQPNSNYFGSDSFSYKANDGSLDSGSATVTINVSAVNDAPTLSGAANRVTYIENASGTVVASALTVGDVDSASLASATVRISAGRVFGDTLNFVAQNGITGSFDAASGTLTLTGSASVANYQAALRSVTYSSSSEDPTSGDRTIDFIVNDGTDGSNTATSTVAVTAVNDAPTVAGAGAVVAYTENGTGTVIAANLTTADPDNGSLTGATVLIGSGFVAGDQLLFTNTGGITGSYNTGTGVLTLTGTATVGAYQTALRSIQFASTSENPGNGDRTINFTTTDGAATSAPATQVVQVTPVNDAPAVTASPTLAATEQVAVSLKGTTTIADVDAGTSTVRTTLTVGFGAINASVGNSGVTIVSGNNSGALVIDGSVAATNAFLGSGSTSTLTYTANSDTPPATATLGISVNDNGNTGGGALTGAGSTTINIAAINDAPKAEASSVTGSEDDAYQFKASDFSFSDVDDLAISGVTIFNAPSTGTLSYQGVAVTSSMAGTFVPIGNIGQLSYIGEVDGSGTNYANFTFTVRDNGGGTQTVANSAAAATMQINLTADNSVYTLTGGSVVEGGQIKFTVTRSEPITGPDVLSTTFANGGDTSSADYTARPQTVTIAAGATSADFFVQTTDDVFIEGDDTFRVDLTRTTGGNSSIVATANGTILNNDSAGTFSVGDVTITEGDTGSQSGFFTVTRTVPTGGTAAAASISFSVQSSGSSADSTATAGTDYSAQASGTLNFAVGQTSATVPFTVIGDTAVEQNETFRLLLSNVTSGGTIARGVGTATIVDNDRGTTPTPTPTPTPNPNGGLQTGTSGNDVLISTNTGNSTLSGGAGNDTYLVYSMGDVVIDGVNQGTDILYTTVSYNMGENQIEAVSVADQMTTGPINLIGNYVSQTIVGNYGNNVLNGGGGQDTLIGLFGDDTYAIGDSGTVIQEQAGQGNDTLVTSVDYRLGAGVSIETFAAQDASSTTGLRLTGNELAQTIAGTAGADTISGGGGRDVLIGGAGADTFLIGTIAIGNVAVLADFASGTDRIGLTSTAFNVGTSLDAAEFVAGTAATTADQRVIYDAGTGQLFYDADGNGTGAAVLFAQVVPGTAITAASFDVVVPTATTA